MGEVGDVNEADSGLGSVVVVEQGVQDVVAHEGTGTVGHGGGDPSGLDGLCHCHDIYGGEVGGGALGAHVFSHRLIAPIVGDLGIADIHGDPLRGHRFPFSCLTYAEDHMGG